MENFADRMYDRERLTGGRHIISLNPQLEEIPEEITKKFKSMGAVLFAQNKSVIDLKKENLTAIILDASYYERFGVSGIVAMKSTIDYGKMQGILTIVEGNRSGTSLQMENYGHAYLEPSQSSGKEENASMPLSEGGFDCDCLTLGRNISVQGLRRIAEIAKANYRGVLINFDGISEKNAETFYRIACEYLGERGQSLIGAITIGDDNYRKALSVKYPEMIII